MNLVEIEQAISDLAEAPFDAAEFPYAFLEALGARRPRSRSCARATPTSRTWAEFAALKDIRIAIMNIFSALGRTEIEAVS